MVYILRRDLSGFQGAHWRKSKPKIYKKNNYKTGLR